MLDGRWRTSIEKGLRPVGVKLRRAGISADVLTGVGVAATRSLPGQPFYGLKGVGEDLQLKMADGDTAKGTKHLEFASTRLREIRALAHGEGQLSLGAAGTQERQQTHDESTGFRHDDDPPVRKGRRSAC